MLTDKLRSKLSILVHFFLIKIQQSVQLCVTLGWILKDRLIERHMRGYFAGEILDLQF